MSTTAFNIMDKHVPLKGSVY